MAVYGQVRHHEFVDIDDLLYVVANPHVQKGINAESVKWAFTDFYASNWHPLTWLTHMSDVRLYGLNSGPHHLTNLGIHLSNVILLFLLLRLATGDMWPAAFVSAIFAVHPLNAESVAWVAERKNVLSTFFWFLTMWAYVHYAKRPNPVRYMYVMAGLALGLMAKPMLVTAPGLLLLIDYWPLKRQASFLTLLVEKIPFFGLSIISSYITIIAQKSSGAMASLEMLPLSLRTANAVVSYLQYIKMMVWPSRPAFFYPISDALPPAQVAVSGLVLVCITMICFSAAKRYPYLVVGWLWYILTLVPVIGLVQVGRQAMADRYTYVPFIGLYVMMAWGGAALAAKWRAPKIGLAALAGILILALGIAGRRSVQHWKNSTSLYEQAIRSTRNNYIAHYNLANALFNQGRVDESLPHYIETVRIKPYYYPAAHFNLGYALAQKGKLDEAIEQLEYALKANPAHAKAHNTLGNIMFQKGNDAGAREHFTEAVNINPDYSDAQNNLGNMLFQEGKYHEAVGHYREALRVEPKKAITHLNLGNALATQKQFEEALVHYSEALRINPGLTLAQKNMDEVRLILKNR